MAVIIPRTDAPITAFESGRSYWACFLGTGKWLSELDSHIDVEQGKIGLQLFKQKFGIACKVGFTVGGLLSCSLIAWGNDLIRGFTYLCREVKIDPRLFIFAHQYFSFLQPFLIFGFGQPIFYRFLYRLISCLLHGTQVCATYKLLAPLRMLLSHKMHGPMANSIDETVIELCRNGNAYRIVFLFRHLTSLFSEYSTSRKEVSVCQ